MKVLYVNYIYQKGHVNFDHIHINALMEQAPDVKLVLHWSIAEQLPYPKEQYALIIPPCLNINSSNGIINRLFYILTLIYLKIKLSFADYDKVIFSSMEELSFGLVSLCKKAYIICHDNARNWDKGIKGFFLKKIATKNTFVVFNSFMAEPFKKEGIRHYIVSHGCIQPFTLESEVTLPIDILHYDTIIFHPSNRPNEQFIEELKASKSFHKFLKDSNSLLILRSLSPQKDISDNIIYINDYLSFDQYKKLFLKSDIILMAYPDSFSHRVSGVSFEAVANKKCILIKRNQALSYCKDFYNYDPLFSNIEQLQEKIIYLRTHSECSSIVNPTDLLPNYSHILSSDNQPDKDY